MQLWETVQDSWDHDAEARITAGCIAGRLQNLSQRYPPSSDDPASLMPFLAPTSSINTPASSSSSSSLEVIEAIPVASEPNPDAVPLLTSSPVPHLDSGAVATKENTAVVELDTGGIGERRATKSGEREVAVGTLRSEALRRKERLINLRKQAEIKDLSATSPALDVEEQLPKPIFRNYKPISEELKDGQLPEGSMIDLDAHVAEQLEAAKAQSVVDEVNLFNLAPRKPDWDLKRGVEKKLKKLERRTQRVIAEIIRKCCNSFLYLGLWAHVVYQCYSPIHLH
ncbi:unnamed protein product [Hydatigera taeniaeformis]|uniref:Coiled-coil domain-containing protein 12 n=1 Tax=Hydatigena taeniaeformis TaxID=6205 RepID=A0A0R3X6E7_HYDTA|nr:unnamed protein product [Hydatigera taeniaeformis]